MEPNECKVYVEDSGEVDPRLMIFGQYRKNALAEAVRMLRPFRVETMEGTMSGKAGDYLMRGPAGELYPCDATIFESTYEEVVEKYVAPNVVAADAWRASAEGEA